MCMGVTIDRQLDMIWRYVCGMDICGDSSQHPSLLWTTGKRGGNNAGPAFNYAWKGWSADLGQDESAAAIYATEPCAVCKN